MFLRFFLLVFLTFQSSVAIAQQSLSRHTEDVLRHVIIHEIAHALIREFDIPLLGNEEVIADSFATIQIANKFPTDALRIISARVRSLNLEADEATVFAEHPSDKRRAGRIACIFHGLSPRKSLELVKSLGMTNRESLSCRDSAPEIARGWRRELASIMMPKDAHVTEVRVIVGEGPWKAAIESSGLFSSMREFLAKFDWHSQITLHFDHCDSGANWSRKQKRILVCDDLITRFEQQAKELQ